MDTKTYTITPDGKGSFEIQINHGPQLGSTYVHDFKTRESADEWVNARKGEKDKVIHK
jgi:hypothetical protein